MEMHGTNIWTTKDSMGFREIWVNFDGTLHKQYGNMRVKWNAAHSHHYLVIIFVNITL